MFILKYLLKIGQVKLNLVKIYFLNVQKINKKWENKQFTFDSREMLSGGAMPLKLYKICQLFRAAETDELGDRFAVSDWGWEEVAHVVVDGGLGADLHSVNGIVDPRENHQDLKIRLG